MYKPTTNLIRLLEAINHYGLSRSTFDKAANDGFLTKHRLARAVFLDKREIEAWIRGTPSAAE